MDAKLEQKARELLAVAHEEIGKPGFARIVRDGDDDSATKAAIRAIARALESAGQGEEGESTACPDCGVAVEPNPDAEGITRCFACWDWKQSTHHPEAQQPGARVGGDFLLGYSVSFMDGWLQDESDEVRRNWQRVKDAATTPPAKVPEGISDDAIKVIWRAAMTGAHNICIKRSDRWNDEDGPSDRIDEANECAKEIAGWLEADDAFIAEVRAMLAAAPEPEKS